MSNSPAHSSRSRCYSPAHMRARWTLLVIGVLILSTLGITPPALAVGVAAPDAPGDFLNESFTGTSAPGWALGGSAAACLTANSGCGNEGSGNGWLRLTNANTYQAGYAYYNTPIPTGRGLVITFDYGAWGGTGADGTTFFLFDGATPTFRVGASGGSLGYAQKTGVNGLSNGYLGLGLDEFGNYSNGNEGRSGGPGYTPESVAIRGPGNGRSSTDYRYLAGTTNLTKAPWSLPRIDCPKNNTVGGVACGNGSSRPSGYYRQVRIIATPVGSAYQVTVAMKFTTSGDFQTLFGPYTMPTAAPGTLKMGFAGSTGGSTNYHEIRNLTVAPQVPDLTATKSVQNTTTGGGSVAPGEQLLYTVVLKNNTSTEISSVSFTDPIPENTTYVANSASASSGTVSYNASPATLSVSGITVPANGQATVTFKVQVNSPLPDGVTQISNQGSFTYGSGPTTSQTDGDAVTDGNQATTISVTAGPNFDTSTKTVSLFTDTDPKDDVSPGDTLLYHVVLPNTGNQNSPAMSFTDVLPSNTTYVNGSATVSAGTASYNSTTKTLTWAVSVNAGSQATLDFKVTVNSGVKIRDVISNQGTLTYGTTNVLTDADLATPGKQPTQLLVGGQATLTATKTASVVSAPLQPGGDLIYTIALKNTGTYAVSGATFVDTLPANTTYVSSSTNNGTATFTSPTLNVTGISLISGATATITFRVQVNSSLPTGVTQISNQGVANYDSNQSGANNTSLQTDGDPNTAGQQPTVNTLTNADLVVTKSVDNSNPAEGAEIVYTVRVTNNGPAAVTSAAVADTLPAGLTYVSFSASQGSYTSPTWSVGALASGASATLTLHATVDLGKGGSTLTNSATASSELYDAAPDNNTASVGLTVKTTTLTGAITDAATGTKLANVEVKVTDSSSPTPNVCTTTTDSNGNYSFTSGVSGCLLAAGSATVETTSAAAGYLMKSASKTIVAGTANTQDFALVRPSLSGTVITQGSGVPIVGATVTLVQGETTCTATTDAGGAYSFTAGTGDPVCNITSGSATVSAAATKYQASGDQSVTIKSDGPTTQTLALGTADLVITKSDGKVLAVLDETIAYVITVQNIGSIAATNVTVRDTLGSNLTYVSNSLTGTECPSTNLVCTIDGSVYVFALGTLAAAGGSGDSISFTISAQVTGSPSSVSNYARAYTDSPENDTTNNEVMDIDTVDAFPDLTISKTDGATQVLTGDDVQYTITYRNTGNHDAAGVTIVDTLLNGVEIDASKLSGNT